MDYVYVVQMMNEKENRKDILHIFANRGDAEIFTKECMDEDPSGEWQSLNLMGALPADVLVKLQPQYWENNSGTRIGFQRWPVQQ